MRISIINFQVNIKDLISIFVGGGHEPPYPPPLDPLLYTQSRLFEIFKRYFIFNLEIFNPLKKLKAKSK